MSSLGPHVSSSRRRKRLLWLSRRATRGGFRGVGTMTLSELEDSRRPLLFSLLPRMLRADGTTPRLLQRAFGYIDQDLDRTRAITVSRQRWRRALATSRELAARRARRRKR